MNKEKYNYKNFKPAYYDLTEFPGPKAGEDFVDVDLQTISGERASLSNFLNKPLVIETGSITCPMYAKCVPRMEEIRNEYPDINFLLIYVREAHPGEKTRDHSSLNEKTQAAQKVKKLYKDNRTVLVDNVAGDFHKSYGLLPNMVYIINPDGKVRFRGDWNNPDKIEEILNNMDQNEYITEEHFEPAKPNPKIMAQALSQGGFIAIWDFIKGIPGLLRLHKKANEEYDNKS